LNRIAIASVASILALAGGALYILQRNSPSPENDGLRARIGTLEMAVADLARKQGGLQQSLEALQTVHTRNPQSLPTPHAANGEAPDSDIAQRLQNIERQLAALGNAVAHADREREETKEDFAAARRDARPIRHISDKSFTIGEEAFQADAEAFYDTEESAVREALEALKNTLGSSVVECKSSMCKITYRLTDIAPNDIAALNRKNETLINKLSETFPEQNPAFRYAIDERGMHVLYVSLRRP
jgi:chromosome segregation ATPase